MTDCIHSQSLRDLPVYLALPRVSDALAVGNAVLVAPPGAGKTTAVPLFLHGAGRVDGRIVMLEPRRLAARAAAMRMADLLGERVGETVGYRMRMESKVGPRTRIEVVTEGVMMRMIQSDPELSDVGLLIFDEFHERSLNADLSLALALDVQATLRDDLRLLVMSATLEAQAVCRLLRHAPVIESEGRSHPVHIRYLPVAPERMEQQVAYAVAQVLAQERGSVLVFVPGVPEIHRVMRRLAAMVLPADVEVLPLFANLQAADQHRAIGPAPPGMRKVVLATSVAETSLTIDGIRVVVDSGWMRQSQYDAASGMDRLVTSRVTRDAADQRSGRAGRLEPGICVRLWSESVQQGLVAQRRPEMERADLAELMLQLALWGVTDTARLSWLDAPPAGPVIRARELLRQLEAVDDQGRISAHGRRLAALPLHPRLGHMVLRGVEVGCGAAACDLAALLGEGDVLRRSHAAALPADVRLRLEVIAHGDAAGVDESAVDWNSVKRVRRTAQRLRRMVRVDDHAVDVDHAGLLLAFAYPERIGRKRPVGAGRYLLSGGRGAVMEGADAMARSEYVVAATLDAGATEARIQLAAPLAVELIGEHLADRLEDRERVEWDRSDEAVLAVREKRLGQLVLERERLESVPLQRVGAAMLEGIRQMGLAVLPWTAAAVQWRARVRFVARLQAEGAANAGAQPWPDVSDAALLQSLETWLEPFLGGASRREHLQKVDLGGALAALLSWEQQQALERLAPAHLHLASGRRTTVDYGGDAPLVACKLQEVYGWTSTPCVADGRVPVRLQLLSPANRPLQVTRDLAGFWRTGYAEVRKEMRGRYPKHFWPEDPAAAQATSGTKPRAG